MPSVETDISSSIYFDSTLYSCQRRLILWTTSSIRRQCKKSYTVTWQKGLGGHCPNLVPTRAEKQRPSSTNVTTYTVTKVPTERYPEETYDSLADMWTVWNRAYVDANFPRLIIRLEDILFHSERVMELVSDCLGKPMTARFQYHLSSSKPLRTSADFVSAIKKYGKADGRFIGMTLEDREYAVSALDPLLLQTFHYPRTPVSA